VIATEDGPSGDRDESIMRRPSLFKNRALAGKLRVSDGGDSIQSHALSGLGGATPEVTQIDEVQVWGWLVTIHRIR